MGFVDNKGLKYGSHISNRITIHFKILKAKNKLLQKKAALTSVSSTHI